MPPDDTRPPDRWVTISEAVGLTGKSERTIRRYIADGSLANRREKGRVFVNLTDILQATESPPPGESDSLAEVAKLQAEVTRLSDINTILERELEDWKRQSGKWEAQAALLTAVIGNQPKTIEAPNPPSRWRWPWSKTQD